MLCVLGGCKISIGSIDGIVNRLGCVVVCVGYDFVECGWCVGVFVVYFGYVCVVCGVFVVGCGVCVLFW